MSGEHAATDEATLDSSGDFFVTDPGQASGNVGVRDEEPPVARRPTTSPAASGAGGIPARIGSYEILTQLGMGGMGVVHAAYDTRLDRKVAIKQLHTRGRDRDERRFLREALAMARLSHPNVIPIYEIGTRGDSTFIVMEHVEGASLRQWLHGAQRTQREILSVFRAAAQGLIAAHDKGLVHRDFKPDNVMVGDDGRVRVMDFGLARAIDIDIDDESDEDANQELEDRDPSPGLERLTRVGALVGTPAYMSPEQLRGQRVDAASDQFSFCVALHEALFGRRPFSGTTLAELRASIAQELPRTPSESSVPGWLRELIFRGLAREPAARHPSMRVLLTALVEGESERGEQHTREPPAYVFVAHAGVDKPAVVRLCAGLLDHGVRPWLDMWELDPRRARCGPTLAALADAPAVLVCHGSGEPGALDREFAAALAARTERDPSTVYRVDLEDTFLEAQIVELAQRIGIDRERADWLTREAEATGVAPAELSPYRGLEAFREQDSRWMFGRDREVGELLAAVRESGPRFAIVIGASGSGKSSLVMAGLCPALRHGVLGDGREWHIVYLRPGPLPCAALARALADLRKPDNGPDDGPDDGELHRALLASDDTLRALASRHLGDQERPHLLLVIDQLEELFTEAGLRRDGESPEALAFVRNLRSATDPVVGLGSEVRVVATLRADFVHRCLEISDLASALQKGSYFALPPMDADQIRAAIERPARRVGFVVESKLSDELVAAAANRAGQMPLLQHALRESWQRRDGERRVLTYASYAETGGIQAAITVAAERALDTLRSSLGERAVALTRQLMTRLVHLGATTSGDTRRRASIDELGDDRETREVLRVFVRDARVLVASEDSGVGTIEIAHEVLLREWTTLVGWLDADRDALRLRQEIATSTAEYSARGGRDFLWGKGRLEEARRVLGASTVELNQAENQFLDAGDRAVRQRALRVWGTVAALALTGLAVLLLVLNKNAQIGAQNVALAEEKRTQTRSLSVQRGLRARALIAEDQEREALLLAVLSLGELPDGEDEKPPREAIDALEHVLATDAQLIAPTRILQHDTAVRSLAYSPNGARLVSNADRAARIWDVETGRERARLDGHDEQQAFKVGYARNGAWLATSYWKGDVRLWNPATSQRLASFAGQDFAHSPDGSHLVVVGHDIADIWDARSGERVASLDGHRGLVNDAAYSADGARIATAGYDHTARIWDARTGALLGTLSGHRSYVVALAWSPASNRVATASYDETARIWNLEGDGSSTALTGHTDHVWHVAFSPDGSRLATAGDDEVPRIWDVQTGVLTASLTGHVMSVKALAFSPDGQQVATASADRTARIWNPQSGRLLATLRGHGHELTDIAFAPDGRQVATASLDRSARLWDVTLDSRVALVKGHTDSLRRVTYAPDGSHVATASADRSARIWDADTGALLLVLAHGDTVRSVAYAPDSSRLATASFDHRVRIWDAHTGALQMTLEGHGNYVDAVSWSADGAYLASTGYDRTARIWNPRTGQAVAALAGDSVSFSPDGRLLATRVQHDRSARIWDIQTGELRATLMGHEGPIGPVVYSPAGTRIATVTEEDETVHIWDASTGAQLLTLPGFRLAYSPTGSRIATGTRDGTMRVWNAERGELVATFEGRVADSFAFSPEGTRMALTSPDHTGHVWDIETGQRISTLEGHTDTLHFIAFSPDGRRVATASADHTARIWDAATGELVAELADRIALHHDDGATTWPIPPATLLDIGCERLAPFARERRKAANVCDPARHR